MIVLVVIKRGSEHQKSFTCYLACLNLVEGPNSHIRSFIRSTSFFEPTENSNIDKGVFN